MLLSKQKKSGTTNTRRMLVSISVLGSAGPIRFLVDEDELVFRVIETAARIYARERRLPALGSDLRRFVLYSADAGAELGGWETIGGSGRNFVLCEKPTGEPQPVLVCTRKSIISGITRRSVSWKGNRSSDFKSWINNSLGFKISSH